MEPQKIQAELAILWDKYQAIINQAEPSWEEVNEARAILFLTGQIFCEEVAVEAIARRLHLLKTPLTLIEFLELIDANSERLEELRQDKLFDKLEQYYLATKGYKNKYVEGKYYLEEEKFIKIYERVNPHKELKMGYRGSFVKRDKS